MLHEVITVTIQENQRKVPMRGYSAGHLLALSDPPAYKGPDGSRGKVPDAAAPLADGERWVDDGWRVSIGDETDADGWRYARTFGATGHATRGLTDVCRFRTWTRAKKRLVALDTGLPTAGAPPAPPAASPPPPEIPPEKAFARAMAMAPADRHARVVALAMQISVADTAADAKERATRARSAEAKAALEAEAEACRREAATALEFAQKLEGAARTLKLAAAAAATAREATARKRLALPDYDPANVLRGEDGLCVGVKDATLERYAGRLIISAEPTEAGARATLEALGDDDDGATVEVVVEGLVVVSGKGSRIPTVRVRRVNLRARATWSAAVACISVEINQCVGCTRQFFTKSFLSDDAGVLAPSSGEEPASPRHRAGAASIAP